MQLSHTYKAAEIKLIVMEGLFGNKFATDFRLGIKHYTSLAAPRDVSNHYWNNSLCYTFQFD